VITRPSRFTWRRGEDEKVEARTIFAIYYLYRVLSLAFYHVFDTRSTITGGGLYDTCLETRC